MPDPARALASKPFLVVTLHDVSELPFLPLHHLGALLHLFVDWLTMRCRISRDEKAPLVQWRGFEDEAAYLRTIEVHPLRYRAY